MAHDDRDQSFEKALARRLRPPSPSGLEAGALGGPPGACPDAETLAAYYEGSLSSDERTLWKQHVLSCDACQLVLAHLETPLALPVVLEPQENILADQPPAVARTSASEARAARPSLLHSLRWLWLVPAGALFAGLVAWVSLHEQKPLLAPASAPVEVSENRQAPPANAVAREQAAPAGAALTAPSETKQMAEDKDRLGGEIGGLASPNRGLASKAPESQAQSTQQGTSQYAAKPAHGPSSSMQQQQQAMRIAPRVAGRPGLIDEKSLDALLTPNPEARSKEPLRKTSPAPPQAPPPPPPAAPSPESSFVADGPPSLKKETPPPATNRATSNPQPRNLDAISAANETAEVTGAADLSKARGASRTQTQAIMRAASLENPHVVWAPGEKHAWRFGLAGSLERSTDKGVTWTSEISGVYTDLAAGFAPSAKVCWIVGNAGTILRTTDGGTHWQKVDPPVTSDLRGVRATDATHAWISLAPDSETGLARTYLTTDGGRTWFLSSGQ